MAGSPVDTRVCLAVYSLSGVAGVALLAVVVQPAPVIVDDQPQPGYWYYCPSARAYYPTVPTCPEVWIKVAPRAQ
jgi:hypothetical protein